MTVDDGREGLATLRALLAEAVAGKGRIAMVTGAVATGKSELLYAIAERAFDQGALPLTATGSPAESGLPLGVLSQLLHSAPLPDSKRRTVLGLLDDDRGAESAEHVDVRIVDALGRILLDLAERCPLLIAVDDVHHADRASQQCLAYLARRVKFANVMLVLSAAEHSPHLRTLFHTEVLRQPHCRQVRLTHLSRAGVDARLGEDAHRFGAVVHTLSGGNRLLVDALLEDLQSTGAPGDHYGEAVLACVRRLGPCIQETAYGLAVLGEPGSIGRLLGLGESDAVVDKSLRALTGAGLLTDGRFRHQAARSAVLAELDTADRIHLHRRAAELAHRDGASADVVAGHLLQASHAGDPWALSALEEAARLALRDNGVEAAIEYLKLAWRACDDERRRARIGTALVRAEWRIDPGAPTGHLAELTDALRKGHLGGGDTVVLAKALLWHGHVQDAINVLDRLRELGEPDQETTAELAAARPWFRALYPSFLAHLPEVTVSQATAAASSLGVGRRIESAGALAGVLTHGPREETVATAEHILRGSRLDEMTMDTVETALLALTYTDRSGRAAPWCDAFIAEAETRGAPSRQARLSAIRAEIGLREGDLAAAAAAARRALEIIPAESWGVAVGGPLGTLLLAGAAMGRLNDFLPEFNRSVPEAMLETRHGLQYLRGKGRFNLMADQPDQALRDFLRCGELMTRWELDVPGFIAWRLDAAEALIALREDDEARRLVNDQLSRCGRQSQRVRGSSLRLLAAVSEVRHRPAILRQAADLLEAGGDQYEYARLLFDLTEAYHATGEHRRAGMLGQRARALAEECHAEPLSRALPRRDWDDAAAADLPTQLSDAERRVAELAADGLTNREISGRLFITVSTVEQHLTRVFRKLKVSRRTDLPELLAGEASA
ncbi:LuxR family transcriptional regulator [Acrocarpospora corrugata]|uniref:LuxR family transcriptional regulator n=1 Tax=Acrocarpospora corrugata TaxID=35763 RepID=A0A5M3VSS3_9ACTN|nr:LuxR family transcriptional regulator [Acrocarpospora corrugata]GER99258.1 LuxR family transcriptional regulator [Acrocarpospora corrugata]